MVCEWIRNKDVGVLCICFMLWFTIKWRASVVANRRTKCSIVQGDKQSRVITWCFSGSTRCPSSLLFPTRQAWPSVQQKRSTSTFTIQKFFSKKNFTFEDELNCAGVHPHWWSGIVCVRLPLPGLPRVWKGNNCLGFLLWLIIDWLVADVQARPGQQCLHLPWCQPCHHCRRWKYLTLEDF